MKKLNLNITPEDFPLLFRQYKIDALAETLYNMCKSQNLPINEENVTTMAVNLESGLEEMFPEK